MNEIDKLAWICIRDGKLLVVKSKNSDVYYVPGGKREIGETDQVALMREIQEELSVTLQPNAIEYAGSFRAQAHGKPEGVMVKMTCYVAAYSGDLTVGNEIESMQWVTPDQRSQCSTVTQVIMDALFTKKMNCVIPKNYQYILFDADNTLFHFDDFRGLAHMFHMHYNIAFTRDDYHAYHTINKPLWVKYEKGEITAQQLQQRRFLSWGEKLQVSTEILNHQFLTAMAETCFPLQGARSLLFSLKNAGKKIVIITNGFVALHAARLERTGLTSLIDHLVVSEAVGVAKPNKLIFEHASNLLGNPPREQVLMVGDTPASDIQGGHNMGIDTCWFNADGKHFPADIQPPTYTVSSLQELQNCLLEKSCLLSDSCYRVWEAPPKKSKITPLSAPYAATPKL